MKLLVIAGGGREHALAWRLAQPPRIQTGYIAPGNGGSALADDMQNQANRSTDDLIASGNPEKIAYTVVGTEDTLADGIGGALRSGRRTIFGHKVRKSASTGK